VERDQGVALPGAYRRFLEVMGRDGGGLWTGTEVCYPEVLGLREAAVELLEEDHSAFALPSTAVVFMMHQGYQFMFLDGADPRVYWWTEERINQSTVIAASLAGFVAAEARRAGSRAPRRRQSPASVMVLRRLGLGPGQCPDCGATFDGALRVVDVGPDGRQRGERLQTQCGTCGGRFCRQVDDSAARWTPIG
jgi:hypothetical protein